ncbi:DUF1648 domain-containing protein [Sporosarcina aquimarina]|uniref:DUF1648 domain-containing protein n=1 Tax=Sporosarcina aquimarina TaxID=114975 RepID=A0ABU4FVU0_9BACL|nr:DUF1648 domain-containing protein [Sporosarcina aquimarina]MDW0108819.1 DUF1648 domain-containing protein [Sporosarcina aquimarina]
MTNLPPRVETQPTKLDRLSDVVGIGVFIASVVYIILKWSSLPDEVPIHFNAAGEADGYGSPYVMLLLTAIGAGLWALLQFLERHPEWHNYPRRLNETNAKEFYQSSRTLLNRIKNLSLILFAFLNWETIRVALGDTNSLSKFGMYGVFILIFGVLIVGVVRQQRIK